MSDTDNILVLRRPNLKRRRSTKSLQVKLPPLLRSKKEQNQTNSLSIHPFIKQGDKEALHRVYQTFGKKVLYELSLTQQTPLHIASEEGHLSIVDFLLSNGAKLEATDMNGWTALHCACYRGNIDIIMYLLAAGADCLAITDDGNTPLHYYILKAPAVSETLFKNHFFSILICF